jgi:hypothetical protein
MKKRNLKLGLKKDIISKLEMQNIIGGNIQPSTYPPTTPTVNVPGCAFTHNACNPAPIPTCNAQCATYYGNNTCPCENTALCTIPPCK